jgi:hypothetical protein
MKRFSLSESVAMYLVAYAAVIFTLTRCLGGCALAPDSVRPELRHLSHLTQHAPFTDAPTRYGADTVGVYAHWDLPHRAFVEVGDGVSLDHHYSYGYGEVLGPREQFEARVGFDIRVRQ